MKNKQSGYIALMTVLIIMAVVVSTATTVSLLAIGETQSGFSLYKGESTLNLVEGCVEDAMLKIRSDSSYGGGTISRPEGACIVSANLDTHPNWEITVTNNDTTYKRQIRVRFTKNPTGITLTSWKEE